MSLNRARVAELSRPTNTVNTNYSEQQHPASPQRAPSSSNHRQFIYSDNPNCPPIHIFTPSTSRQVSFCNDAVDIPVNESSGTQDVRAQVNQPVAPVIGSTAILEPPVSQNNSFLNRSQPRNSFLLNISNNCNLNLTPDAVNSEQINSSTSRSYVMELTSPAELQVQAAVRTAHKVPQRFNQKGAKYAGGMDESLEDRFLTYRTSARDYQLRNSQKVELIYNLFHEESLRFYNNHVREKAATIEEVYQLMSKEFNSITRQEKVKNQLHSLKLHHFVKLKGMTANEALDHIQAKINAMLPQCPKEFNHDSYNRDLLRAAVVGNRWASEPISRCTGVGSTFQEMFQALHSSLHQHEEEIRARRTFSRMHADNRYHPYKDNRLSTSTPRKILYTEQGRYGNPRSPGSRSSAPRPVLAMVVGTTKVGKNGLNLKGEPKLCFSCSFPDHILPCPNNVDLQAVAMQKLRDDPDNAKRIYREFVVQMENGMATEQAQQECVIMDDDDDESKATNNGNEATAFYTEHASDYSALEQSAMDATNCYDDSIDALLDENISGEDF
jgi:hypothetical protein